MKSCPTFTKNRSIKTQICIVIQNQAKLPLSLLRYHKTQLKLCPKEVSRIGRCPDKCGKPFVRPSIWRAKSKFESSRAFHSPRFDQSASRGAPERRAGPTDACFWLVEACRGFRVIFWLYLANCFTSKWHFWWMVRLLHQMLRNSFKVGRHFTLPLRRVQRKSGRKFEKFGVLEEPE